ncbi:MAG: response regulator [Deltaproteobacteria bacterium]|nr:response regulator [Deltaproteobacteria bacterium]
MSARAHILVVDDDRRMVRTLVDILRIKGHHAHPAHSEQEALEKLEKEKIDCVLSDIRMPGVSGVGLCRTIKERKPLLPVILMTAYSDDRMVRDGLKEGAIAILPKPLDIDAILPFFSSLREKCSIATVDDDPGFWITGEELLRERGFSVTTYTDPLKALENSIKKSI